MKARIALATVLIAAAGTIGAGCSTDDAVNAVTSKVAEVTGSTATALSTACRKTTAAASNLQREARENPPAALTEANAALDSVKASLSGIAVPEGVKAAWQEVVGDLTQVGDTIDSGVATAKESGAGQQVTQAANAAAARAKDLSTQMKELTAQLGLNC